MTGIHTMAASAFDPAECDPGIREVVTLLRSRGFHTCDSGDGKTKIAAGWPADEVRDVPHVVVLSLPDSLIDTCHRVRAVLEAEGVRVVALGHDGQSPGEAVIEGVYFEGSDIAIVEVTHLDDAGMAAARIDLGRQCRVPDVVKP